MKATLLTLAFLVPAAARADEKTAVHFNQDVRPILSNRCFKCHGTDLQKGGLDLQTFATATKKLDDDQPAFTPGDAAHSELFLRVTATERRMPPKGDPLTPEQIAVLKAWIDQGAKYEEHWAYVKPVRKPFPEVKNKAWPRNGIDQWVLARLEQEGLTPSPEADKPTLLRRVSLDLTGLPPTLQELDAFLADQSPDAYEKAVDRLLASPAYGEHQARYWLDLARYADTNGYEKDDRRSAWPYRDWVINAFNKNMPFDEFTIEQIAGDLLPNATLDQKIATGFHRNTMVNTEGGTDDEEFRVAAIVDRVNTTMTVWMGTTSACTQCHNHKFDPFKQKEFYQLFAFFNGTEDHGRGNEPELPLPTPEQTARIRTLQDGAAALEEGGRRDGPGCSAAAGAHAARLAGRRAGKGGGRGQAGDDAGDEGVAAAAADARHAPRQLQEPRRGGQAGRAGQAEPAAGRGAGQPPRPGQMAGGPEQPADGPRDHESHLGAALRQGNRRNQRGLRHAGRAAQPPGIARLAGRGVHGSSNGT